MNKRQTIAVGIGLVVFGWLVWRDLSPYLMLWLGPRGGHLTVTYFGFPTGRVVAAVATVVFTVFAVFNLRSPRLASSEIKLTHDTQEGVWPPAPQVPK